MSIETDDWVPRCRHGHVIMACTIDDCPDQVAYLTAQDEAADSFFERQRQAARELVRGFLGLDP